VRACIGIGAVVAIVLTAAQTAPATPWAYETKVTALDGAESDGFGCWVAMDGDYTVVGARGDDDNGNASGSAYILHRSGLSWTQTAKLTPSDGAEMDRFGHAVSISGDYALVDAHLDDDNGEDSGSAYVFRRSGATWTEMAKLTPDDGAADDQFGYSLGISGDYALVGSPFDDNGEYSGSAYVFQRSGDAWAQAAKLTASDADAEDAFGFNVSISGDLALVGSPQDDDNGHNAGAAYVFQRSGGSWTQVAKLSANDGAEGDALGLAVAISGNTALVGAFGDDDNGHQAGAAYVFRFDGASWHQEAKLTGGDGGEYDYFGQYVALDGDRALVGAWGDDDPYGVLSGSAYIFERDGSAWRQTVKLTASDGAEQDVFGMAVAISGDWAAIGAPSDDDLGDSSGSVYFRAPEPACGLLMLCGAGMIVARRRRRAGASAE